MLLVAMNGKPVIRAERERDAMPAKKKSPARRDNGRGTVDMSYLESTIGYMIRRAQMAVFLDIRDHFGDIRLTLTQFSVLAVTADNPGINQADMAAAIGVERPRMVPVIDALEKLGLAERRQAPEDRRNRQIFLTAKGEETLTELKKRFAAHQDGLLERLDLDDPSALLDTLKAMSR